MRGREAFFTRSEGLPKPMISSLSSFDGRPSTAIPNRVLLIEDNPGDARLILEMLQEGGPGQFLVDRADRLSSGLEKLSAQIPDVVMLDLNLPDSRGIATFSKLYEGFPKVPIVVLTGLSDEDIGVQAVRAGAQDYLVKGVISANVLARVLRYGIERKRAEAEHLQLVTAIEQAMEAVVITDSAARIQYVNPAFTKITGYEAHEVLGRTPRMLNSGKQDNAFYQNLWSTILAGNVWHGEIVNRRKDGSLYTEEMTITRVRDQQGVATNFIAIKQDVTERKRTEEALSASEIRYRRLFETAQDGILLLDAETGAITEANPHLLQMLGYTAEEIVGKKLWEIGLFRDILVSQDAFRTLQTEGYIRYENLPLETKSADRKEVEFISNTYRVDGKNVIQCNIRDITERKRAEDEVRKLNASLEQRVAERTADLVDAIRALRREAAGREMAEEAAENFRRQTELILNSAGEGICGLDLKAKCTFANPAARRILGYTQEELIGQDLHMLFRHSLPDGSPCPPEECGLYAALKHGGIRQDENQMIYRRDGTWIQVDMCTTPIIGNAGVAGAVLTLRDVSERRAVEKMKEGFVSVVSHELRTPLTAIRGALGLMGSGKIGTLPPRVQRMVEIAINNTDRLVRLVSDILDSARLESEEVGLVRKVTMASELMVQAGDLMRPMAETTEVRLEVQPQPLTLYVDPDAVLQVLINLASNAIKFSPRGSAVRLECRQDGADAEFRVIDHGLGIPKDKLESIFGRFQPVDASDSRRRGGTGLGLSICRRIIHRHGGRIWAESELGRGCTFVFTLPLVSGECKDVGPDLPKPEAR
jgi:PAS domain S-box-containing protein